MDPLSEHIKQGRETQSGTATITQCTIGAAICVVIQNSYCGFVSRFPSFPQEKDVGELPVNRLQRRAAGTVHARDSDNARASLQVRQTFSRNEEYTPQVRVTLLIPVLKRRLREGNVSGVDACAVKYVVQSAKLFQDGGYERLHFWLGADIDLLREKRGAWYFRGQCREGGCVDVAEGERSAEGCQFKRRCAAA